MAQQTDLAIRIAAIFDAAGMNKADKSISKLEKNASKLGKTLGIALSAAAITAFGKSAVKAFTDDQKSAAMLTLAVKNLGLAFEQANIDKFISDLEGTASVADDVLRPAFQALLTTTGSVIKSQELLKTAIEASRGSGIDLATVAQDLANAYVGNTKGLKKYNLGLTQAELKAMSFLEIQERMNEQFKGASAAYLATYTGQMEALSVAAGNAAEIIGQSLVEAILNVSGATDASTLGTYIENVAGYLAGLIDSVAKFVFSIKWLTNPKNWLKGGEEMWAEWDRIVQKRQMDAARLFNPDNNAVTGYKIDEAARNKALADAALRQKQLAAAQEKNTKELKKQNALKLASKLFDMQQIQLVAALKGKLTEEERTRLEAQSAILNGNDELATSLTKKILLAQDESGKLYQYFISIGDAKIKNPFAFLDEWLAEFQKKMAATKLPDLSKESAYTGGLAPELAAIGVKAGYGDFAGSVVNQASTELGNGSYGMQSTSGFVSTAAVTGTNVSVYVSGSVVTEQELVDAIQSGLRSNSLSGSPSQIGRIAGMFG